MTLDPAAFVDQARRELEQRERNGPRQVIAGTLGQAALDASIANWRAIVELLETGSTTGEAWQPLLSEIEAAEALREAAATRAAHALAAVTGIRILAETAAAAVGQLPRKAA